MAAADLRAPPNSLHPIHLLLTAAMAPLFLAALLSDLGYAQSYQPQWSNFASWLIAGALVFGGCALLAALIALLRRRTGRRALYFLLLLATWGLGFVDALVHAKDAWAMMPEAVLLSAIVAALALLATAVAFAGARGGRTGR